LQILCLFIEHFPAATELRERPELAGQMIIVAGFAHERKPVFDCSQEASQVGIQPGMSLREACHLCPDAIFLPLDETKYFQAFDGVLDVLERFSPAVESDSLGTAFLDIFGLEDLFGSCDELAMRIYFEVYSRTGFSPKIGIAASKFVAAMAANMASLGRPVIVDRGKERGFLEGLPVDLLPLSEETKRRLDLLGVRTMGQIASFPKDALVAQFGHEGLLAHQLASGIDERPLVPRVKPTMLEEELSCEAPVADLDGLIAGIGDLLDRLIPRLKGRNQACKQVKLRIDFDDGSSSLGIITLKAATDSKGEILGCLRRRLESARFPSAITGISLGLMGLGSNEAMQSSFVLRVTRDHGERVRHVVGNLKLRFGNSPLKRVVPLDPKSRIPERRASLIDFEP